MHGNLGAHVPRHAAQEPKLAQDQRMVLYMVVAIALDPHLRMKLAIHIAAGKRDTVVGLVFGVVDVIVRGACANYQFMSSLIKNCLTDAAVILRQVRVSI